MTTKKQATPFSSTSGAANVESSMLAARRAIANRRKRILLAKTSDALTVNTVFAAEYEGTTTG